MVFKGYDHRAVAHSMLSVVCIKSMTRLAIPGLPVAMPWLCVHAYGGTSVTDNRSVGYEIDLSTRDSF